MIGDPGPRRQDHRGPGGHELVRRGAAVVPQTDDTPSADDDARAVIDDALARMSVFSPQLASFPRMVLGEPRPFDFEFQTFLNVRF